LQIAKIGGKISQVSHHHRSKTMAYRGGLTTDPQKSRKHWEAQYPSMLSWSWMEYGPYETKEEAQVIENALIRDYGPKAMLTDSDPAKRIPHHHRSKAMACRGGITTDIKKSEKHWKSQYPTMLSWSWVEYGPYDTKEEAQVIEKALQARYGREAMIDDSDSAKQGRATSGTPSSLFIEAY
jgi:hypothetical protein